MYITCMTSLDILIYHDLSTYQKQRNTTSPGDCSYVSGTKVVIRFHVKQHRGSLAEDRRRGR